MMIFKGPSRILWATLAILMVSFSSAQDCCLCDDCDFMMAPDTELYDIDADKFVSCERFAEEIFSKFESGGAQCTMAQDLFKTPCCFTSQNDEKRRLTWGTTTYPFQSSSFSAPSSYLSWGAAQTSAATTTTWGSAPASTARTFATGEVFTANPIQPAGASCPRRSGICDFNCPNVPADRQAIHVSVDPTITGRDIPYFGALCSDVQNQFHCQNVLTSDLRCNLMIARYRGECGCGGFQNNGASFFGTTESSGTVGQWTISTPNNGF